MLALTVACLAPAAPVRAQVRAAAVARINLLNKKAMDEYDSLEFEAAKAALVEALGVARGAGITRGKALTETYLDLGVVYGAGLNDRINAVKYFTAALRINRNALLNPARATPALEEMFESAKAKLGKPPPRAGPPFRHTPVDEANMGRDVTIRARVAPGSGNVILFYRTVGSSDFRRALMQQSRPGIYIGVIPGSLVRGRSIYYYIEVQDAAGERVHGHGTAMSPNIISVRRGRIRRLPPKPPPRRGTGKVFSIGLMAGTGAGIVNGGESEHVHPQLSATPDTVDINPGGAWSPFHLAPELSYHLNDDWHLCLLGRIQIVNALRGEVCDQQGLNCTSFSSKISWLGQARAKRFFGEGTVRFYMAFGAGAGQIRHRIPLGDYDKHASTANEHIDSRVAGIGAFGLGGGISVMFSTYVGFVLEVNGLIMVPNFAANLDLNTGLVLSF